MRWILERRNQKHGTRRCAAQAGCRAAATNARDARHYLREQAYDRDVQRE
jgi:hypothetical protein